MTDANDDETRQAPLDLGSCAAGCDCGRPATRRRTRLLACLLVSAAAGGILFYKATAAKRSPSAGAESTFATAAGPAGLGPWGTAGGRLASFAALNTVASGRDAVLVLVPAKGGDAPSAETRAVVDAVLETLRAKGIRTGFYTLAADSLDYGRVAAEVALPAVVALTRGGGMGTAPGPLTEEKVMQAYVASNRASACCPSSSGSPAACPP